MFNPDQIIRHRELISDEALSKNIVVIGAGAIGGFTVLSLAKMGFQNITVYDFDTVEIENIGAQFFDRDSIGRPKVEALRDMVYSFTGIKVNAINAKIDASMMPVMGDILITAVDNMATRKLAPEVIFTKHIIDPRMGAEYATLDVVDTSISGSLRKYKDSLFSDAEGVHERCTAKTTIYTVLLIAGQVVKAVKDITMGSPNIKTMDWAIRDNSMVAFSSEGAKL